MNWAGLRRCGISVTGLLATAQLAPAISAVTPLCRSVLPALAGVGSPVHVALTFDDGPDARSTPVFLDACDELGVTATFFLLGIMARRDPELTARIVERGHDVAVLGWDHRVHAWRSSRARYDELARARDTIGELSGQRPVYFRPPYGVLTATTAHAAHRAALTPVLWTCWGRDWTARATPASVRRSVRRHLHGGGTILLHDSDCTSAPEAWRSGLGALPGIVEHCRTRGIRVGPLREHGIVPTKMCRG